ncbi:hypothetical protein CAOG_08627 [Capsaspora owczarzaki ATCC 30864]|uniref:PhoD-like phosphatase metallophosphatase domain-containing protein n=1 Tax=Capsaspora owczarzaki (strain ATCC 30864) TaxID=595528 RepID=A0A0D2U930_CAPO3|nr:hypothetical protein CAOG_08627 [Capsaspora owczarzaki ATCC 30864]KJE91561.1 hypothetical protein CAOG_008627 [Capsaspora owczarzaki ATCC 30864]|eukprot:XP_011270227.1 hypothetical protein CAOG_08627 [Capsaspora owczarzaki ATCC 30864]
MHRMHRRVLAVCCVVIALAGFAAGADRAKPSSAPADVVHERDTPLTRVAFGSCSRPTLPQRLWKPLGELEPEVFAWLGDVVYADSREQTFVWRPSPLEHVRDIYAMQKALPEYKAFVDGPSKPLVLGVWDDHDFNLNNGGDRNQLRDSVQEIFLDFLDEPAESLRRQREGLYVSHAWSGPDRKGRIRRVKLILLDVRYFRQDFDSDTDSKWAMWISSLTAGQPVNVNFPGVGDEQVVRHEELRHKQHRDHSRGDMLGDAQWTWLEAQLRDSAEQQFDLTLIGSGVQVLSDTPIIEKWGLFGSSQRRLLKTVHDLGVPGVVFLSGDVHMGEMLCTDDTEDYLLGLSYQSAHSTPVPAQRPHHLPDDSPITVNTVPRLGYPLFEFTSSGMTHSCKTQIPIVSCLFAVNWLAPGTFRVGPTIFDDLNFGFIEIDWDNEVVEASIRGKDGAAGLVTKIPFSRLRPFQQSDKETASASELQYEAHLCPHRHPVDDVHLWARFGVRVVLISALLVLVLGVPLLCLSLPFLLLRCVWRWRFRAASTSASSQPRHAKSE